MSAVPDVIDALIVRWRKLGNLQVEDGPTARDLTKDALLVGFVPQEAPMVSVEQIADLRGGNAESFVIASVLRCWSGGDDLRSIRRRAYGYLAVIRTDLVADPTLAGVVARARFTGHIFSQYRNEQAQIVADLILQVGIDTWQ